MLLDRRTLLIGDTIAVSKTLLAFGFVAIEQTSSSREFLNLSTMHDITVTKPIDKAYLIDLIALKWF